MPLVLLMIPLTLISQVRLGLKTGNPSFTGSVSLQNKDNRYMLEIGQNHQTKFTGSEFDWTFVTFSFIKIKSLKIKDLNFLIGGGLNLNVWETPRKDPVSSGFNGVIGVEYNFNPLSISYEIIPHSFFGDGDFTGLVWTNGLKICLLLN